MDNKSEFQSFANYHHKKLFLEIPTKLNKSGKITFITIFKKPLEILLCIVKLLHKGEFCFWLRVSVENFQKIYTHFHL